MKLKSVCFLSLLACCSTAWGADGPAATRVGLHDKPDPVATGLMHEPIFPFSVHSLAFSPDGNWLLTGLGNGIVRVWDPRTGQIRLELPAHTNWAFALQWFPDAKRFATGGGDNLIHLFDVANLMQPLATLAGHSNDVHAVAITPDGGTLVSAGDDRLVLVWDVKSGSIKKTLVGHTAQIPSLALHPRGTLIASGSRDRTIRLWALPSGEELHVLKGHEGDVMSVQFSPDGQRLVSASYDQSVRLWDINQGTPLLILTGHTHRAMSAGFVPGSKLIASAGDRTLRLWDSETGVAIATIEPGGQIDAGQKRVAERLSALAFLPDGKAVAVGSTTGAVYLYEIPSGRLLRTLEPPARK